MADIAKCFGLLKLIDTGTVFKVEYNGTVRIVINKTSGAITFGSSDGTGSLLSQFGSVTINATGGYAEDLAVEGDTQVTGYLKMTGGAGSYLKFPNLTTTEKDALAKTDGLVVYDSTLGKLQVCSAGAWVSLH